MGDRLGPTPIARQESAHAPHRGRGGEVEARDLLSAHRHRAITPAYAVVLRARSVARGGGQLPGFDELARRAEQFGAARLGWPAPLSPLDAIDAAEHDLALLHSILQSAPRSETVGMAHYLLSSNDHLARALRFRARRWIKSWTRADGLVLVDPDPAQKNYVEEQELVRLARTALAAHDLGARSYSPTALQNFASCPYKFVLARCTSWRRAKSPRPSKSSTHCSADRWSTRCSSSCLASSATPVSCRSPPPTCDDAQGYLDKVVGSVAERFHEELAPAILRVWDDGIASIRADLREMLRRATDETEWVPGLISSSRSASPNGAPRIRTAPTTPAVLDCGIRLRGSIDLIERRADGALRATDYKTGKARAQDGAIVGGGEILQPVLYALIFERSFLENKSIRGASTTAPRRANSKT